MLAFVVPKKINFSLKYLTIAMTCALAACGSGGGDSGTTSNTNNGSGNPSTPNTGNQAPSNVSFKSVNPTQTTVALSWNTATDDTTATNQLNYELHLIEGNSNFEPSAATQKFTAKNVTSTTLTGLKAQTSYVTKLVVKDAQGLATISSLVPFTTQSVANNNGGAGGGGTTPTNTAPQNVAFNTVKATNYDTIAATWKTATDDTTVSSALLYELYLKEGATDFTPNSAQLKFFGNATQATLTGLNAQTDYALKLVVKDAQGLASSSTVFVIKTPALVLTTLSHLNDTGITKCANNTNWFNDCSQGNLLDFAGLNQDAQVGRDYLVASSQISKTGAGSAGFDFSKISSTGQIIASNAIAWACVQDNVTGLMWEAKTTDGGIHEATKTYAWYSTNYLTNGGDIGESKNGQNTDVFIKQVNTQKLCGYQDWRLPNKAELDSIINYGTYSPAIDSQYFVNTQNGYYWTADSVANGTTSAWAINFRDGSESASYKGSAYYVRLVRTVNP